MESINGTGFAVYAKEDFEMAEEMVEHFANTMQFLALEFDMSKMKKGVCQRVDEGLEMAGCCRYACGLRHLLY